MRISQNNIVQNTISFVKGQNNSELKAMVGSVLQGHISGVPQNQTALFVSGEQQLLVNIGETKLTDQQALTLKIVDFKEGTLIANILTDSSSQNTTINTADVLGKLGVLVNAENAEIIEAMKSSNVPITKENFQALRQSLIEVKTLLGELKNQVQIDLSKELSTPIKALVMKLIQLSNPTTENNPVNTNNKDINTQVQGMPFKSDIENLKPVLSQPETLNEENTTLKAQENTLSSQKNANISNSNIEIKNATNELETGSKVISNLVEELTPQTKSALLASDSKQIFDLIVQKFSEEGKSEEAVKNLLSKFDLNTDILHLKNELPVSIKSVFIANEQLNNKDIIVQRFENIINHINTLKLDKASIAELLDVLKSQETDIEKLSKLSEVIKNKGPDSELKTKLDLEISLLKEHTTLTKPLNDQIVYMPITVPQGNQEQRVSLYYKKNQKKADYEDFTLLVALNTKTCGEVRCVLHKLKNQISLSFNFEDEATKRAFEESKTQLMDSLSAFAQYKFSLTFSVRENKFIDINEFEEAETAFGFDIKV